LKAYVEQSGNQRQMAEELKEIKIYTDGACSGNPGPGGYACVLIHDEHRKELSGGFRKTTNNRMEIIAAVKGLEALKYPCKVKLYSDSKYLINAMTKGWAVRWKANFWMRNKKEAAQNPDLWKRLLELCDIHETTFIWVKGHASNKENNRCDELAVAAYQKTNLPTDEGYENTVTIFASLE
jgi:ribonuclease HI